MPKTQETSAFVDKIILSKKYSKTKEEKSLEKFVTFDYEIVLVDDYCPKHNLFRFLIFTEIHCNYKYYNWSTPDFVVSTCTIVQKETDTSSTSQITTLLFEGYPKKNFIPFTTFL